MGSRDIYRVRLSGKQIIQTLELPSCEALRSCCWKHQKSKNLNQNYASLDCKYAKTFSSIVVCESESTHPWGLVIQALEKPGLYNQMKCCKMYTMEYVTLI